MREEIDVKIQFKNEGKVAVQDGKKNGEKSARHSLTPFARIGGMEGKRRRRGEGGDGKGGGEGDLALP